MEAIMIPEGRSNIQIAIAEDHGMTREFLVKEINSLQGCNVVLAAHTGRHLINGIIEMQQKPDIVITDINMPLMNGYETQLYITQHWPQIKTLAISIYDDKHCIAQMLRNGACGFVSKNSSPKAFYEALVAVLRDGYYYAQIPEDVLTETQTLPKLTEREREYLTLVCQELSNEDIADKMCINARTVETHKDNVYRKLKVSNKAELIFYVKRTGIVYMK